MKFERRILIVDDNELLITLIKSYNTFWELNIDYSQCAKDALIKLKKIDYNILLLDMKLPDASGLDVIPIIKEIRPELKIIIVTGGNQMDFDCEERNCRFDGFLQKPFKMAEFREAITQFDNKKVN